ncbi:hypothetical protein O0I10_002449 [Lichtheimia ornata]|uniref:Uncharacterized protein n=1 Tax=Lichtheimia ornata TaxID=688661 RepID=A0AAD7Y2P1_9FUNG|nr:uncharacterized protein O0I10_002449 [Lichtheimia ornata]KAJ8661642.1 hypothetical protein O0I10_002449 [Lichtheimia ornata]
MELGDVRSIEEVVLQGARLCIRRHQAVLPVDIHFFLLSFDSLIRLNERQTLTIGLEMESMKDTSSRLAQKLHDLRRGYQKKSRKKQGKKSQKRSSTSIQHHVQGNKGIGVTGTGPPLYDIPGEEGVRRRGFRECLTSSPGSSIPL